MIPLKEGRMSRLSSRRVLVVDDEEAIRSVLLDVFEDMGCQVICASNGREGLNEAVAGDHDLAVLDLSLPGFSGMDLLGAIKEHKPDLPVVMITGYASMDTAVEALRLGAYDYMTKPFDLEDVRIVARRAMERGRLIDENRYLREELRRTYGFDNVVGLNPEAQQAFVLAAQVSDSRASVLLLGETGTGKEYLARAIHYQSPRANGPFVKVSCAALPETLLESELFGHEKGAFTGAIARRIGRFELADGGDVFLDEIGDTTPATQLRLLRILQEKQFERVGGAETLTADVRVIAATNKDLKAAIAEKTFREDLYYRLNVVNICIPPLRERAEDIPEFVGHFIRKYNEETGKSIEGISQEGMSALLSYSWPGNIRELENCIERAVILCRGRILQPSHLRCGAEDWTAAEAAAPGVKSLREVEKEHIARVLAHCDNNQTRTASVLGVDRKTLRSKIRDYGLGTQIADAGPEDAHRPSQ